MQAQQKKLSEWIDQSYRYHNETIELVRYSTILGHPEKHVLL